MRTWPSLSGRDVADGAQVRVPAHLPSPLQLGILVCPMVGCKGYSPIGPKDPQRVKVSKCGSVLPPTVLLLTLHTLGTTDIAHTPTLQHLPTGMRMVMRG